MSDPNSPWAIDVYTEVHVRVGRYTAIAGLAVVALTVALVFGRDLTPLVCAVVPAACS